MATKRVLLADDHPVVREGLKQIINESTDLVAAGEASDGYEALEKVRQDQFDAVLLDLTMPGIDGLDVLKQIKAEQPKLPVLILSMHPEKQYALRALRAGASGYLTKADAPGELVKALRKVCMGGKYITASLAEKLASHLDSNYATAPHEELSDREYQVMCFIASGKTVTEIAEQLSLSVKTVSTYRARILEKMNMKSNAELTYYAIKNQLVE